jgi:hypothetical protein
MEASKSEFGFLEAAPVLAVVQVVAFGSAHFLPRALKPAQFAVQLINHLDGLCSGNYSAE